MIRYKRAASTDSEDTDTIGMSQEERRTNTAKDHEDINGHQDPKQRKIYVVLLLTSILFASIGLSLILVWMLKFRSGGIGISNADQMTNLHPVMMFIFMVSLNMYAILIYRTHYYEPKQRLKWAHAILSGGNMVMSLLGVFVMLKSHWDSSKPNFYSLHSWIGTLTNVFYVLQFLAGFFSFLMPGMSMNQRARLMPWHRLAGSTILVLAGLAAITGITELVIFQDRDGVYSKFTPITFLANFSGISVVLMTTISVYLVTAPQYRRPKLSESETRIIIRDSQVGVMRERVAD